MLVWRSRIESAAVAEIAEMRRLLAGFAMQEERKWGKPTYTVDGKNIVIVQGFRRVLWAGLLSGRPAEGPQEGAGAARSGCRPGG